MWIEISAFFAVLVAIILLLLLTKFAAQKFAFSPELARKIIHVSMGLTACSFYYVFQYAATLWILAFSASAMLLWLKRKQLSSALHGVERQSFGEVYFAFAIALLFQFAEHYYLYLLPLLILTFADTAAALIGQRFGQRLFITFDGVKSLEGTFAFAGLTALLVAGVLWALTALPIWHIVLIALILAILISLFEGAAWRGTDNVFIPFSALLLLQQLVNYDWWRLIAELGLISGLTLLMVQLRRRTMLDGSALFAVILTSYFSLTLGGIEWLIAANLFLIFYSLFARFNQSLQRNSHSIAAFWSVAALPMLILIAYQFWPNEQLTQLWIVAFATHLSLTSLARNDHRLKAKKFYFALIALCEGVGLVVLPLHLSPFDYPLIANAAIAIALACLFFMLSIGFKTPIDRSASRWIKQAFAGAMSVGCFTLLQTGGL